MNSSNMLRILFTLALFEGALCFSKPNGTLPLLNKPAPERTSDTKGNGVLSISVTNKTLPIKHIPQSRHKRNSETMSMLNVVNAYLIDVELGTPPQTVSVLLDTGSSELWVNPECSTSWNPSGCVANGQYNSASSSTSKNMHKAFSIGYGCGSAAGTYFNDTLTIGGADMPATQFGNATTTKYAVNGILGISYGNPADSSRATTNYPNVIDQLYLSGFTQSRAFSLDLNSIDSDDGAITFGGVDTMKYSGSLQKMPIIPRAQSPDKYSRYWINLNSISITKPGSTCSTPVTAAGLNQPIFADSGSTLSALPTAMFNTLLAFFPDAVSQGSGMYTVPCSYRSQAGSINFGFGNTIISVPYHEWFWYDGAQCWFGAQSQYEANTYLLGESFMRSAYIVYDQDNANVHLAPAASCGSNVVAISTGSNAVPSSTGCAASTTVAATCGATSSSSTGSTSSLSKSSTGSTLSTSTRSNLKFEDSSTTSATTSAGNTQSTGVSTNPTLSRSTPTGRWTGFPSSWTRTHPTGRPTDRPDQHSRDDFNGHKGQGHLNYDEQRTKGTTTMKISGAPKATSTSSTKKTTTSSKRK